MVRRHSVEKRKFSAMQIFSSNEFRVKFLSRKLLSRNFSEKIVAYGSKIPSNQMILRILNLL